MAKVTIRIPSGGYRALANLMRSAEMAEQLEPAAEAILRNANRDPNEEYRRTLRKRTFISSGPQGRVSWQVGAEPTIGARVEAKRGTMARAITDAGL